MLCPRCGDDLHPRRVDDVVVDRCLRCHGAFYELADARAGIDRGAELHALLSAKAARKLGVTVLACPLGHGPLTGYACETPGDGPERHDVEIDHCPRCNGLWLDVGEAQVLRRVAAQASDVKSGVGWYFFQLFSGLPLEVFHPPRRRPAVVPLLVLACLVVFGFEVLDDGRFATQSFAFSTSRLTTAPWTLLTYIFLHAGLGHLVGNMIFLWIFGDNIEDRTGRLGFLFSFLAFGVTGAIFQAAMVPGDVPLVGASGAIAGLLGAYLVLYPRVRLFMVVVFLRFRIPAWLYLGFWILTNVAMATSSKVTGVAWWCHIGGFAAGILWGIVLRRRGPKPAGAVD